MLDEQHLASVLTEFVRYDNEDRPHRTLGLKIPEPRPRSTTGQIRLRAVLNGLHHIYERAASDGQRQALGARPGRNGQPVRLDLFGQQREVLAAELGDQRRPIAPKDPVGQRAKRPGCRASTSPGSPQVVYMCTRRPARSAVV